METGDQRNLGHWIILYRYEFHYLIKYGKPPNAKDITANLAKALIRDLGDVPTALRFLDLWFGSEDPYILKEQGSLDRYWMIRIHLDLLGELEMDVPGPISPESVETARKLAMLLYRRPDLRVIK